MSQKLPVNGFNWVEDLSEFDEGLIKIFNKKVNKDIFLKVIFNIQKIYTMFRTIYLFYLKE